MEVLLSLLLLLVVGQIITHVDLYTDRSIMRPRGADSTDARRAAFTTVRRSFRRLGLIYAVVGILVFLGVGTAGVIRKAAIDSHGVGEVYASLGSGVLAEFAYAGFRRRRRNNP